MIIIGSHDHYSHNIPYSWASVMGDGSQISCSKFTDKKLEAPIQLGHTAPWAIEPHPLHHASTLDIMYTLDNALHKYLSLSAIKSSIYTCTPMDDKMMQPTMWPSLIPSANLVGFFTSATSLSASTGCCTFFVLLICKNNLLPVFLQYDNTWSLPKPRNEYRHTYKPSSDSYNMHVIQRILTNELTGESKEYTHWSLYTLSPPSGTLTSLCCNASISTSRDT